MASFPGNLACNKNPKNKALCNVEYLALNLYKFIYYWRIFNVVFVPYTPLRTLQTRAGESALPSTTVRYRKNVELPSKLWQQTITLHATINSKSRGWLNQKWDTLDYMLLPVIPRTVIPQPLQTNRYDTFFCSRFFRLEGQCNGTTWSVDPSGYIANQRGTQNSTQLLQFLWRADLQSYRFPPPFLGIV